MRQRDVARSIVFTIITCEIHGIYWVYKMCEKQNQACWMRGMPAGSNTEIFCLILMFFGLGVVVYALAQDRLNKIAQR